MQRAHGRLTVMVIFLIVMNGTPSRGQSINYTNETEVGMMWSSANFFSPMALTLQSYNGIRFDQVLSMGITAGIDEYFGLRVVPIAIGSRGVLPGNKVSPYIGVEVGYGFTWLEKETHTEWHDGGMVFNPTIGLRWKSRGRDRYLINVGYKRQVTAEHTTDAMWGTESYHTARYTLNRMSVRFGMIF